MQLLDGKLVSEAVYSRLKNEVDGLKDQGVVPFLVIVLVGNHPSSLSYIRSKLKNAEKIGVKTEFLHYEEGTIDTDGLAKKIVELNGQKDVHGILVQLPLPDSIESEKIVQLVDPKKDVDGFSALQVGQMFLGKEQEDLTPCTPMGVIRMLEHYGIDVVGKRVTVVGSSNIVGKPLAVMLTNRKATVTVCHSKTVDLKAECLRAEILIVAVGRPGFITADMVTEGAVVIDVGINRVDEKIVGDVDFDHVSQKSSYITPVPGGCGLMTVACLMENVVKVAKKGIIMT